MEELDDSARHRRLKTDIPRVTSSLAGKLPLSCSSGKPDLPEKKGWDEAMPGRLSKIVNVSFIKTHLSREFERTHYTWTPYTVDATGGGRNSAIVRKTPATRVFGMATSAIWNAT
jgi:hypothetical protein